MLTNLRLFPPVMHLQQIDRNPDSVSTIFSAFRQEERPQPPKDKLTVSYTVWRGPANISSDPVFGEVLDGQATTEIEFSEPGEYQLKVHAFDGGKSAYEYISVNVE